MKNPLTLLLAILTLITCATFTAAAETEATMTPTVEQIKCGINNAFIVTQGDSAILVDTATSNARTKRKILRACAGKDIKLIVLTHGHYDHAQNAAFLSRELGAPVAMHPADVPLLTNMMAQPLESPLWTSKILIWFTKLTNGKLNKVEPFELALELYEGLSLEEYGIDAEVIALPGHSDGSIGIVTPEWLIAGDALTNLFPPAGKAALWSDKEAMEASAAKAAALGDLTVYFGHGKPAPNQEVW